MSTEDIALEVKEREVVRKGLRKLRDNGQVPAVIHDHGKPSVHVMADYVPLLKTFEKAGKHHPVQLKLAGKEHLTLIKDADFEPVKRRLRHVVFQAIKQNEEVETEVPIVFKEDTDIPAEKMSLLVLKQLDHVQVKAFPKDLPDQLIVDPSSLADVGDHLTVADLQIPAGVTLLTDPTIQIAIVEMPRDQIAEADAAAAALAEDAGTPDEEEAPAEEAAPEAESTTEE
jgi:large subunit ribosomal protein L25